MTRQIDNLLLQLVAFAMQIEDGSSLKSVMEQTLLFGRRMGQIGCDFSSLVLPLFEKCMVGRYRKQVTTAVDALRSVLRNEKLAIKDEYDNIVAEQVFEWL